MENSNHDYGYPMLNTLISISGVIFAWVTMKEVQVVMTMIATGVSICTGSMAIYQFWKRIKNDTGNNK